MHQPECGKNTPYVIDFIKITLSAKLLNPEEIRFQYVEKGLSIPQDDSIFFMQLARGDYNHDGFEDLLVAVTWSVRGHKNNTEYATLSRIKKEMTILSVLHVDGQSWCNDSPEKRASECQKTCEEMKAKGEIKPGFSIEDCRKMLCSGKTMK